MLYKDATVRFEFGRGRTHSKEIWTGVELLRVANFEGCLSRCMRKCELVFDLHEDDSKDDDDSLKYKFDERSGYKSIRKKIQTIITYFVYTLNRAHNRAQRLRDLAVRCCWSEKSSGTKKNVSRDVQWAFEPLINLRGMDKVSFENVDDVFARKLVQVMFHKLEAHFNGHNNNASLLCWHPYSWANPDGDFRVAAAIHTKRSVHGWNRIEELREGVTLVMERKRADQWGLVRRQ